MKKQVTKIEELPEANHYRLTYNDNSTEEKTFNKMIYSKVKAKLDKSLSSDILDGSNTSLSVKDTDTAKSVVQGDTALQPVETKSDTAEQTVASKPVKKGNRSWEPQGTVRSPKLKPELADDYITYYPHRDSVETCLNAGYEIVTLSEIEGSIVNVAGKNLDAPVVHNEHVLMKLHKDAHKQMLDAQRSKIEDPLSKTAQLNKVTESMDYKEASAANQYLTSDIKVTRTAGFER